MKLLAGMYAPTAGHIEVDGLGLSHMDPVEWRERLAGAFQDFARFEFVVRHTVGVGDLPRIDDEPAVAGAVESAGASDVVDRLGEDLGTQLAGRGRPQRRPMTEAGPGPRLGARPPVAGDPR